MNRKTQTMTERLAEFVTELTYELKKAGLPVKDGIIRNEELVEELKRLDNN